MKKALLILTLDCPKSCELCCNKLPGVARRLKKVPRISDVSALADFDEVKITGGEPLMDPMRLYWVVRSLRQQNLGQKLFLYTAAYDSILEKASPYLAGITFSLHWPVASVDHRALDEMQKFSLKASRTSMRLVVDYAMMDTVAIGPGYWNRIDFITMSEDCGELPDTEFFIWEDKV